jgi:2-polyprenyl-3-methyl-5-hydroxy-6-metoxy-1,4-benzoquinol methylase
MDIYKETAATWNKIALLYQDKFMQLDIYNETYDFFCNSISKNEPAILEIGCGPGNITKFLLSKRPDFQIDGIDIAPNMVALAKINNPSAEFKVMDSRKINELHKKYEGIVCGFCLPYLSEADCLKLIIDCNDLLTDSGALYISFVEGDQNKSGYQVGSSDDRIYFYYYQLDKLNKLLIENGFEKTKIFNVPYEKADQRTEMHTILIAKKKHLPGK